MLQNGLHLTQEQQPLQLTNIMSYTSNTIAGLSLTTPTAGAAAIDSLNDSLREIKRALQYSFTVASIDDGDSPYTAVETSSDILADATSGAITINLPAAVGISGRIYTIKKIDSSSNAITIDGYGAELIDGAANNNEIDTQYDLLTLECDGTGWHIVERWIH